MEEMDGTGLNIIISIHIIILIIRLCWGVEKEKERMMCGRKEGEGRD